MFMIPVSRSMGCKWGSSSVHCARINDRRAFESLGGALRARMRTRSSGLSESADASGGQSAAPRAQEESRGCY